MALLSVRRNSSVPGRKAVCRLAAAIMAAALGPGAATGQSLTQDEALALAFPAADSISRRTAYLSEDQLDRIAKASDPEGERPGGIVTYYVAYHQNQPQGVAYFDAHRVRTLDQVLMIVVGQEGRVRRVETVRFREPPEYRAPEGWLALFHGRELGPELSLKRDIPNVTGATLTADAVTRAVRRVLALHEEVAPFSGPATAPPAALVGGGPP